MCPQCESVYLMVKECKGWERIMIWITGKRLYNCCDCDLHFRSPDRRQADLGPEARASASIADPHAPEARRR
jgi:hypothetical protein